MSERDRVSFSSVIMVLWITSLSLHLVANVDSSFTARRTYSPPHGARSSVGMCDTFQQGAQLTSDIDALTGLQPTGMWSYIVELRDQTASINTLESNSR